MTTVICYSLEKGSSSLMLGLPAAPAALVNESDDSFPPKDADYVLA
jgi:hypothetical protein